jgi:hypothetical protein
MSSPRSPRPGDDPFGSWLERSIERPVFIDRSEGEKAAEQLFIHEKAKTERWNRSISKALFALQVGLPATLLGFLLGALAVSLGSK